MAEAGLDFGNLIPGGRRTREPEVPPLPVAPEPPPVEAARPAVIVTPPPPKRAALFGDLPTGHDALGIDGTISQLAELALHRDTAVPLCIGIVGPSGSGKSFALNRLTQRISALAEAAGKTKGPFVDKVHVQTIDAASLDGDIATALAARLHAGLRQPYPALAREIAQAARDPHVVLRETNDKLDDARRRLDSERRALDDAGSRRARLTETVLYEAAGSQVDAYARANRVGIESRLVSFGINGDPIRNYKDLVQLVAGSSGKISLAFRSLWAFKGQLKLILSAILAIAVGIGLGIAIDDQTAWLGELRSGAQTGTSVANWFQGHIGLLSTGRSIAFGLATLAILANLWRAFAFLQPILKGVRLLDYDLDNRRRDLDGLYAHQTKRVDALDKNVERLTCDVGEAERRAGGTVVSNDPSPFEAAGDAAQAQNFFAVLTTQMTVGVGSVAPKRIVVALDHLDAVTPDRARAILDAAHRGMGDGILTVVAADPARLDPNGMWRGELERWVQVPVRIDAGGSERDYGSLVANALGLGRPAATAVKLDAHASLLDSSVSDQEARMLAALASIAGPSPRAVKRFANLYSLARLDGEARRGALAMMLVVAQGGSDSEKRAVADALLSRDRTAPFDLPAATPNLRAMADAASALDGPITTEDAIVAARRAATFAI